MESDLIASPRGSNDNQQNPRSGWVFRKLWPRDAEAHAAHLRRLDPAERSLRFGRAVADEWLVRYVASTDWFRSVILGCWVTGKLRGVGEIKMLDRAWPRAAEAALSVERHRAVSSRTGDRAQPRHFPRVDAVLAEEPPGSADHPQSAAECRVQW